MNNCNSPENLLATKRRWSNTTTSTTSSTDPACAAPGAQTITAPHANVWNSLTDIEAASVANYMFTQSSYNLTATEDAGEWDNTLLLIEVMDPNKTDVLNYFAGTGTAPTRYAHVILDNRATEEPNYQDLLIGPLPLQNGSLTVQELTYPYTRKTEGKVRNLNADQDSAWSEYMYNITGSILDITLDLWNGSLLGLDNDTLDCWGIDPLTQDDGITRWDMFWNLPTTDFDSGTLLPLGLYFKTNITGRDPSKWQLQGWLYNDIFYENTETFRAAYWSPGFEKLPANIDGSWGWTDQDGTVPELDTNYPPMSIAPSGSRYFVDTEQQYVKWQDFEFYVSFNRDTGMHLHNIKYKGERIIYELGLQEALAHYAGNDPVQSGTSYLDTYYGFGTYAFELVKGYDCPSYATYLNTSFYTAETTHTHIDSICLFETEANFPIQRHSTSQYVAATKNIFFTIRTVCTVGNYDYMFSYEFYVDGSINIVVRASGYIQSAYFAKNTDYGYQIHDALSGSMHDHVLNFKIDFDILGTANTMTTTSNIPVSEVYPWSNGKARNTMKLQRGTVSNEDEGKLDWAANGATQFTVVNTDAKNKYGEYRGYRILPSSPTIHLTVENSSNLIKAANWAKHDLYVTRHHDTEPRASHPYQSQDVANPPVDFDKFFNSESLEQEDIVVWANVGMHHVPHTGDLPNTVFTTAHSGLQIMPLNYLLGSPAKETVNMVRVNYGDGNKSEVLEFGQGSPDCGVESLEALVPDLTSYVGDTVVRKFPYDPNDPYFETDSIE
ncbi:membrane copper amine oxidase [Tricladium varicosporioides]|nr:membrane copper amine oxidase [Hymenoscyphus varicosporioides]